jgi:two-component system chemotaxis response regulator CheY
MTKRVLVVEDSTSMRQLIAFTLERAGYDVVTATDPRDALGKLDKTLVDMVITDLTMPEMNGIEFIKRLRGKEEYRITPVVMLTSTSQEHLKQEGKEAGATAWVVKPFSPEGLNRIVSRYIR